MIYDLGNLHEETVIANIESEAKRNAKLINTCSKFIENTLVYK